MFSIKNVEGWQKLNQAVSLQNQVHEVRLQDKLGKQNYRENAKNRLLMQLMIPLKF